MTAVYFYGLDADGITEVGSPIRGIDDATGLKRITLDGNSGLKFTTEMGAHFTVTFYAQWDKFNDHLMAFSFTDSAGQYWIRAFNKK